MKGQYKDYDPVKRRGTKEVDFSFSDKIIIPKIFNKANVIILLFKE